VNVADLTRATAERLPDRPALIFQDRPISYAELNGEIDRAAAGVVALGIRPGDRVLLMVQNIPQFVTAYLGTLRAGGVVVPLNTMYTADEVSHIAADSEARAVIVAEPFMPAVEGLRETLPLLEHVVVVGDRASAGMMTWEQMLGRGEIPPMEFTRPEVAQILIEAYQTK
jgi:long-chain acyl-CoA synthetase